MGSLSIAYTKGLPYGIFMKHLIHDLIEKGQLHKIKKKWEIGTLDCSPLRNTGKPLSIKKMYTAFIFIMSGIVLALLSLFIEVTFNLYVPKSSQKDVMKNHPKLRICLNEWKAKNEKASNPDLFSLIKDVENYLDFGKIQPSSMYKSISDLN